MVRALAFHQCGPGSILGPGVTCGLSLLLVLVLTPRGFLRVPVRVSPLLTPVDLCGLFSPLEWAWSLLPTSKRLREPYKDFFRHGLKS